MTSLSVVVEPSHSMASSNTKDKNIFRLANGNYISRKAYVYMVASEGLISHRHLTPNESKWAMSHTA
jgi:hypothetical protein